MIDVLDERLKDAVREVRSMAGLGLRRGGAAERPLVIGITSPDFGDGKTTLAMGLASSLTDDLGVDVMLADTDFHTHSLGRVFGVGSGGGLNEVLAGAATLESVTQQPGARSMTVVPAAAGRADPDRLHRADDVAALIENMRASSRYVVLDLPATMRATNAAVLASMCDGVIVVVRGGHTTRQELERTLELLVDANVLGVVVNRWSSRVPAWARRVLGLRR